MNALAAACDLSCAVFLHGFRRNGFNTSRKWLDSTGLASQRLASARLWRAGKDPSRLNNNERKNHIMKNLAIIFTTILSAAACFGFLPQTQAVVPPPDGGYPGFNTAEGQNALLNLTTGTGNVAVGWASLYINAEGGLNTAIGTGTLLFNTADQNTATGAGALLFNNSGRDNTANGAFALHTNAASSQNTAFGVNALHDNDSLAAGLANNNTAVGATALESNVDGSENTAVGAGAGPNLINGFNNTYVGDFVGTLATDENSTIRIGDLSNGNGTGSLACFIGGIFNNFQPVGGTVVEVTLDLDNDQLGWDIGPSRSGSTPMAPVQRSAPQRHTRPAMPNGKVGKVEKLEATVAQQQKQIETLTAQLKEQSAQIQKVSAQIQANKPAPQLTANNE